ncbi:hypothetical protein P7D22_14835 [Lichenihabitans sp. Uapishka_5]|uniref:hypothetical protein n=1 Tax=Lichenihabitans sp. Uapishka_5 TaxID=3037302 RepID=UPI0029E7EC19|nr:hypothetical protein [Lichenihabitans sp. Uapishka_5]MDX7952443.1 hypothetical protein [Lichenihabitans sp. Uapishka_5]
MNKPLPWNVKGVGFDAREAARLAAKRAGVPLGEWLNTVISARAAELGVQIDDVGSDDRLEAIASRLSEDDGADATALVLQESVPPSLAGVREQVAALSSGVPRSAADLRSGVAVQAHFALAASSTPQRAESALPAWTGVQAGRAARKPAPVPASVAARSPAQAEATQLDDRLNAILAKLNRSFEAAAEIGGAPAPAPAVETHEPAQAEADRFRIEEAARPARPAAMPKPVLAPLSSLDTIEAPAPQSFADLQAAFRSLAEKLEAQVAGAQSEAKATPGRSALDGQRSPAADRVAAVAAGAGPTSVEDLRRLQGELAQLATRVSDLSPQHALGSLESAVRELMGRVDLSKLDGVQASVLAPVERLGRDMREAIRAVDATPAVEAVRRDMRALAAKLDAQPPRGPDSGALEKLRGELAGLREMVGGLTERLSATDRLQDEISTLGLKVGSLVDRPAPGASRDLAKAVDDIRALVQRTAADGMLGVLDGKIDTIAARVELLAEAQRPQALMAGLAQQIDRAHETLVDRLATRVAPKGDLSQLEASIGSLSEKIDSMGRASHDVNALYGLVGTLADRMQDAQDPRSDGDVLSALQAQMGRLIERLDQTELGNTALRGMERLIGDLFLQIEQSRDVAIDAAENAARAAAQDTLRAAMDNPRLNGAELTVQTGLDVDHVSQELAELRRVQEVSDRRVTTTLSALNTTLERLVDHMTLAPAQPGEAPMAAAAADKAPRRRRRAEPEAEPRERSSFGEIPPFDPDHFLLEPGSVVMAEVPLRPGHGASTAPVPHVASHPPADVAPLIAAARRAAQAAQDSALDAALLANADGAEQTSRTRSFFANRRRPLLLGLAGLVLLLGTLQIVRLSTERSPGAAVVSQAPTLPGATAEPSSPKPDKGASLQTTPTPVTAMLPAPAAERGASLTDPTPTGSLPAAASIDMAGLTGLGQGLKDLAASGDAKAQFEVAARLSEGRGLVRDPKLSALWFERAAKQGLAPAQYRLGSMYEKGVGVSADQALAVAWYEKAAGQGNVRAMHNLAVMSAEGAGAKSDYGKALSWFTKAASYGVRDSQFNLAVLLARGLGGPQNLGQSYAWFSAAATQGDSDAVLKRDAVAAKLDAKALAEAKSIVASFHALTPDAATNDVAPPAGGWDAAPAGKTASARKVEARIGSL